MGNLTKEQLQKKIRLAAKDSRFVLLTKHAQNRMRERFINFPMVLDVLRQGTLFEEPEPDIRYPGIKCQMERYVSGVNLAVIVNVQFPDHQVVVVTVFETKRNQYVAIH